MVADRNSPEGEGFIALPFCLYGILTRCFMRAIVVVGIKKEERNG